MSNPENKFKPISVKITKKGNEQQQTYSQEQYDTEIAQFLEDNYEPYDFTVTRHTEVSADNIDDDGDYEFIYEENGERKTLQEKGADLKDSYTSLYNSYPESKLYNIEILHNTPQPQTVVYDQNAINYASDLKTIEENRKKKNDSKLWSKSWKEAKRNIEDANARLIENPYYKEEADALQSSIDKAKSMNGQTHHIENGRVKYVDITASATDSLLKDAEKILYSPDYSDSNIGSFFSSMGDVLIDKGTGFTIDEDVLTLGFKGVFENLHINDKLKEIRERLDGELASLSDEELLRIADDENAVASLLTDQEKALLIAFATKSQAEIFRSSNINNAYKAGQIAGEALPFMAQFFLTGGVGTAFATSAKVATKAGVKSLEKWLLKQVGKSTSKVIQKGVATGAKALAKPIAKTAINATRKVGNAFITPLLKTIPMSILQNGGLVNYSEKMLERTQSGNLAWEGNEWGAFKESMAEHSIEVWSEMSLDPLLKVFGAAAGKVLKPLKTKAAKSAFITKWMKTPVTKVKDLFNRAEVTKLLVKTGYNGLVPEIGEEVVASFVNAVRTGDETYWEDFWKTENFTNMVVGFAPMALFGMGASAVNYAKVNKQYNEIRPQIEQLLRNRGVAESVIADVLNRKTNTLEDISKKVRDVVNPIIATSGNTLTREEHELLFNFSNIMSQHEIAIHLAVRDYEERKKAKNKMDFAMGGKDYINVDANGNQSISFYTDANGKRRYVLKKNGVLLSMDERGGDLKVINEEDVELTTQGVTEFFDEIVYQEKQVAETRRINEKKAEVKKNINAELAKNSNIVKLLNPASGQMEEYIFVEWNGDEVVVSTKDGTVNETRPLNEVANALNIDATLLTEAEQEELLINKMIAMESTARIGNDHKGYGTPVEFGGVKGTLVRFIARGDEQGNSKIVAFMQDANGEIVQVDVTEKEVEDFVKERQQLKESGRTEEVDENRRKNIEKQKNDIAQAEYESQRKKYENPDGTVREGEFLEKDAKNYAIYSEQKYGKTDTNNTLKAAYEQAKQEALALEEAMNKEANPDAKKNLRDQRTQAIARMDVLDKLLAERNHDASANGALNTSAKQIEEFEHLQDMGLTSEEVMDLAYNTIAQLREQMAAVPKPEVSADVDAYLKAKEEYAKTMETLQKKVDYWQSILNAPMTAKEKQNVDLLSQRIRHRAEQVQMDIARATDQATKQALQDELYNWKSGVIHDAIADIDNENSPIKISTIATLEQDMRDAGCTDTEVAKVMNALIGGAPINGFYSPNAKQIFFVTDLVENIKQIREVFIHERQHLKNDETGLALQFVQRTKEDLAQKMGIPVTNVTDEQVKKLFLETLHKLVDTDFYDGAGLFELADEIIAYGVENVFNGRLDSLEINENFSNFIKTLEQNEGRIDLSTSGHSAYSSPLFHIGNNQNERDSVGGSIQVGEQRVRLVDGGEETIGREIDQIIEDGKGVESLYNGELDILERDGETLAIRDDSGVRFNVLTWEQGGRDALRQYLLNQVNNGNFTQSEADNLLESMDSLTIGAKALAEGDPSSLFGQWCYEEVRMKDGSIEPVLSCLKSNGEYPLNIDFSSVCKKRKMIDTIFNRMIANGDFINESLSASDIARINQIIQSHGLEIACGICFVDSKRYNAFTFAEGFLKKFNGLVESLMPSAGKNIAGYNYSNDKEFSNEGKVDLTKHKEVVKLEEIFAFEGDHPELLKNFKLDWTECYNTIKPIFAKLRDKAKEKVDDPKHNKKHLTEEELYYSYIKNQSFGNISVEAKAAILLMMNPNLRMMAKAEDFVASEGWENVLANNPELTTLWNQQKGAAGARANEDITQYKGEIIDTNITTDIFDIAGYRMQSFSDFIGRMWFDYMQSFADLAAKQLPGHAYTKEAPFVKLFGMMGMKINMSLVAEVDPHVAELFGAETAKEYAGLTYVNGSWEYNWAETIKDPKTGAIIKQGQTFPFKDALALQAEDRFTKNAGTIAVGLSPQHIHKLLNDPNIRMVIPYHKSGLPHGVVLIYNMKEINDYTKSQNSRPKKKMSDSQLKAWRKKVDHYNFFLHQLTIAEDKLAAYNAMRKCFVEGDISKQISDTKNKHQVYQEMYDAIRSGKVTEGLVERGFSEDMDSPDFLPKVAAELYVDTVVSKDGIPKFDEFLNEPNYYKVLIDFAVYDKNGKYAPQEVIQFNLPEDVNETIKATLAEDEAINAKMEAEAPAIAKEIANYLKEKKLRKTQDKVAEGKSQTPINLKTMSTHITDLAEATNIFGSDKMSMQELIEQSKGETIFNVGDHRTDANAVNNELLAHIAEEQKSNANLTELQEAIEFVKNRGAEVQFVDEDSAKFHIVDMQNPENDADRQAIDDILNKNVLEPRYKTMQIVEVEGQKYLFPPMDAKDKSEWKIDSAIPIEIDEKGNLKPVLLRTDVNFNRAFKKGNRWYVTINKGNGKTLDVAFNPYLHSATSMLNDQFASAQDRPNLVTVEVLVPKTDYESGAITRGLNDKGEEVVAKNPVGDLPWKAGILTGKLKGNRTVTLSNYGYVVRIVGNEEVADDIMKNIGKPGENFAFLPTNVFPPQIKEILEKRGYKFVQTNNKGLIANGKDKGMKYFDWLDKQAKESASADGSVSFHVVGNSLVGVHNISTSKLRNAIRLGGLANPSVAVVDSNVRTHDEFGEISLILPSSLVDAYTGNNAGTYTDDAWTPMYPRTRTTYNEGAVTQIISDIEKYSPSEEFTEEYRKCLEGERKYGSHFSLKWLFLNEVKGKNVTGKENDHPGWAVMLIDTNSAEEAYEKYTQGKYGVYEEMAIFYSFPNQDPKNISKEAFIEEYHKQKEESKKENASFVFSMDYASTYISDTNMEKEYMSWYYRYVSKLPQDHEMLDSIENGRDVWIPETLENASRFMNKQGEVGVFYDPWGKFIGKMVENMKSLDEIRSKSDRLNKGKSHYSVRGNFDHMLDILSHYAFSFNKISVAPLLADITKQGENASKYAKEKFPNITERDLAQIQEFVDNFYTMPVDYFETKFNRPVRLNEFANAVVPSNLPQDLKDALTGNGLTLYEYEAGNKEDRKRATNEAIQEEGIKFHVTPEDAKAYEDAYNAKDEAKAQALVDKYAEQWAKNSKVRNEDGSLKMVYHGSITGGGFTIFDKERIGSSGAGKYEGLGFNFTTSDARARGYGNGSELYSVYLDVRNPLRDDKKTITRNQLLDIIKELDDYGKADYKITDDYAYSDNYNADARKTANAIYEYAESDADIAANIAASFSGDANKYHDAFRKLGGYDGIMWNTKDGKLNTIIAFESTQIKSADPFTFDDKGQLIPLEQRFNPEVEDIRFHITTGDVHKDKEIGSALHRINKQAKVYRDAINFIKGDVNEDTYNSYMQLYGNENTPHLQSDGTLSIEDEYGTTYHNSNDLFSQLREIEGEINSFENNADYSSDMYESLEDAEADFKYYEDLYHTLNDEERKIKDADFRIKDFKSEKDRLYALKSRVLDTIINNDSNATIDAVHRFRGEYGDRPMYELGGYQFHTDIEYELPDGFDVEQLDQISSQSVRANDIDIEFAEKVVNSYLNEQSILFSILGEKGAEALDKAEIRFSIGRARKEQMRNTMLTKLTNATEEQIEQTIAEIEKLGEQVKNGGDAKIEKLALHWVLKGSVILPEDNYKIIDAMKSAEKNKVDPFAYDNPVAILDEFGSASKEKPINPDTVPTLHKVKEFESGLTIYDVDESEESRKNMRRIIDTHFGKDAHPWCLLMGDGNGNLLEESKYFWYEQYTAYPKQVAFVDGKLVAFFANKRREPIWWDRKDHPKDNIVVSGKIKGDKLGRTGDVVYDPTTGKVKRIEVLHKGDRENGVYQEWYDLDHIHYEREYKDGKLNGIERIWRENGTLAEEINYKNGKRDGIQKTWYPNGQIRTEGNFTNNKANGLHTVWHENGMLAQEGVYKSGRLNGIERIWRENGTLKYETSYKQGEEHGKFRVWHNNGVLQEEGTRKNGWLTNLYRTWYENGQMEEERHYKDVLPHGLQRKWDKDGNLIKADYYEINVKIPIPSDIDVNAIPADFKLTPESNAKFHILGEKGAAALDAYEEATTRLDNLAVARQMESELKPDWKAKNNEDALKIKMATGWERGADGKWRYEIMDGDVNLPARGEWEYLKDVLIAPELYTSYPGLSRVKVRYGRVIGGAVAQYTHNTSTITLNTKLIPWPNILISAIYHEVQHAIQREEGFAVGGHSDMYHPIKNELDKKAKELGEKLSKENSWIESISPYETVYTLNRFINEEYGETIDYLEKFEKVYSTYPTFFEGLSKAEIRDLSRPWSEGYNTKMAIRTSRLGITDDIKLPSDSYSHLQFPPMNQEEINEIKTELQKNYDAVKKLLNSYEKKYTELGINSNGTLGDNAYKRLMGETESRNVQSRKGMSAEERRNSLLSSTEDVAREDQIFLTDAFDNAASVPTPKNTSLDEVLMHIGVYHNSPTLLKKADGSFVDPETGERLGFDHRFMGTGEGNQAHGWGSYFSVDDLRGYAESNSNGIWTYKGQYESIMRRDSYENNAALDVIGHAWLNGENIEETIRDCVEKEREKLSKYEEFRESGVFSQTQVDAVKKTIEALEKLDPSDFKLEEPQRHNYTVDIPDNNGWNYIEEGERATQEQIDRVAKGIANSMRLRRLLASSVIQFEWIEELISEHTTDEFQNAIFDPSYNWLTNEFNEDIEHLVKLIFKEEHDNQDQTGGYTPDLYTETATLFARAGINPETLSNILSEIGFTGIHYDGRRDGECYVIFNENDAVITSHTRFHINSGYTEREDGANISVNAKEAEENGTFSKGNFKKHYGIGNGAYDALVDLRLIRKSEWHHTGKNFNRTDFMSWSDSERSLGDVDYSNKFPEGSLAERYNSNKEQIDELGRIYKSGSWDKVKFVLPMSWENWIDQELKGIDFKSYDERREYLKTHKEEINNGYSAYRNGITEKNAPIEKGLAENSKQKALLGIADLMQMPKSDAYEWVDAIQDVAPDKPSFHVSNSLNDSNRSTRPAYDLRRLGFRKGLTEEQKLEFVNHMLAENFTPEERQALNQEAFKNNGDYTDAILTYLADLAWTTGEIEPHKLEIAESARQKLVELIGAEDSKLTINDTIWLAFDPIYNQGQDIHTRALNQEIKRELGQSRGVAPSMSLEEYLELAKNTRDDVLLQYQAMRELVKQLENILPALSHRKEYDRYTVGSIVKLALAVMEGGLLDNLTNGEVKRLMGVLRRANGMKDVKKETNKLFNIILQNAERKLNNLFAREMGRKGVKIDANRVQQQGALDIHGQAMMNAFKDGLKLTSVDESGNVVASSILNEKIDSFMSQGSLTDEQKMELQGLLLARNYIQEVMARDKEIQDLKDEVKNAEQSVKDGKMSKKDYNELTKLADECITEARIERFNALTSVLQSMRDINSASHEMALEFLEQNKQRINDIQHDANADMEGVPTDEHKKKPSFLAWWRNGVVYQFLFRPLATFDQMLRAFGRWAVNGEGRLWNRFMRGWIDCQQREYTNKMSAYDAMNKKAEEVLGKGKTWEDIYSLIGKLPTMTVSFWDGGEKKQHELTQGNLAYIVLANGMADGAIKLRAMGISEEDVQRIENALDSRIMKLANWMVQEFLPSRREAYNEVHKRMFGASLRKVDNYFPLRILAGARQQNVDVANANVDPTMPSTVTGSIMTRSRNALALDVMGTDAFSLLVENVQQMENWAAFAEWRRDLSNLLSYKRFRNQVKNLNLPYYGANDTLWKEFVDVCMIASGSYRPKTGKLDVLTSKIAKGVTGAKISMRLFTALKQFLSFPAYFPEVNPIYLAEGMVKGWRWSMENLPLFKKRWESKFAGDPILADGKFSKAVEDIAKVGLSPNAFVDALTVSCGAYAIYKTKLEKHKKMGFTKEAAEKRAIQDAEVLYNETQQSSESAFLSSMQVGKTLHEKALSVFRNSSFGYTRQTMDAIRNIRKRMQKGYKAKSIDYTTKMLIGEGLSQREALSAAVDIYNKQMIKDMARVVVFGWGLSFLWSLASSIPYLLFGDDDDKKEEMIKEAAEKGLFGTLEGMTGGNLMAELGYKIANGEEIKNFNPNLLPIGSDIEKLISTFGNDKVRGLNDVVNLVAQMFTGVNPQTFEDMVVAVIDAARGDFDTATEGLFLALRVINAPQSSIEELYLDQIEMTMEEASKLSVEELVKRYADYKVRRNSGAFHPLYDNYPELEKKVYEREENKIKDRFKERMQEDVDRRYSDLVENGKALEQRIEILRTKMRDGDTGAGDELAEIYLSPDYTRYMRFMEMDKEVKQELNSAIKSQTRDEMLSHFGAMGRTKEEIYDAFEQNDESKSWYVDRYYGYTKGILPEMAKIEKEYTEAYNKSKGYSNAKKYSESALAKIIPEHIYNSDEFQLYLKMKGNGSLIGNTFKYKNIANLEKKLKSETDPEKRKKIQSLIDQRMYELGQRMSRIYEGVEDHIEDSDE